MGGSTAVRRDLRSRRSRQQAKSPCGTTGGRPRSYPTRAAWSYEAPFGEYAPLAGHLAFYANALDCRVGGARVKPQPGGFYGGWVTPELAGPFKGAPGSSAW